MQCMFTCFQIILHLYCVAVHEASVCDTLCIFHYRAYKDSWEVSMSGLFIDCHWLIFGSDISAGCLPRGGTSSFPVFFQILTSTIATSNLSEVAIL